MPTDKITIHLLDSFATPRTETFIWDTETAGFGVRVHPRGKRAFVFKCRPVGGRAGMQRKISVSKYGPLTVDQARTAAKRLAGEVAAGRDPGAAADAQRSASRAAREAPTVV